MILSFSKLFENVQQAKQLLNKLGIDPVSNSDYQEIRKMLSGNDGYTFWFVKQRFENKTPMEELRNVWNIFQQERATIQKFSKPLVKLETIEEFWDEYYKQKNLSAARAAYNKFLPEQRNLLDFNNPEDRALLEELSKRKEADEYFYNKSKRYHTRKDLISAIQLFLQGSGDSNFSKLLQSLKADNQDIRYASPENDIIIICVDYPSLRKWGSDTSWCIVPSEGTFRSYNSLPMSQQFIIFLTDETGIKSKIGVTTNINGYRTAHFKNDGYCDAKTLKEILEDRGTKMALLLPTKERILEIPSWNNFSVANLKQIGFTNQEILDKKKLYNTSGTKGDLEHFSKEEIEKYKLLDKTTLYASDLTAYSPEEIEKRGLLKRLSINSIGELSHLNFSYPLLRKIAKALTIKGEKLEKDFLANFIFYTKTRELAIKKLVGSYWLTYTDSDKRNQSIDSSQAPYTKLQLFDLLKPTEEEVSTYHLYFEIISKNYGRETGGEVIIKQALKDLEARNRQVNDMVFAKIVVENTGYNRWILRLSQLIQDKIKPDWCLEKLNSLITKAELELSNGRSYYSSSDETRQFELDYENLKEIRSKLGGQYSELYDKIFNIAKTLHVKVPSKLQIREKDRSGYSRDADVKKTLDNIDFFSIKLDFEDFRSLFRWVGISHLPELLKYLKNRNYDLSNEEDIIKLADDIKDTHDSYISVRVKMIESGVAVEKNYEDLIKWVEEQRKPISSWEKSQLEGIFKKQDVYYKKWQNLHNLDKINEALGSLLATTGFWSVTIRDLALKPDTWFDKWWSTIKDYSWEDQYSKRKDYEHKYFIALVQILAKLGREKELMALKNDEFIKGANYVQDGVKRLAKIIADKDITNSDRTYRNMKLTEKERKLIFKWLNKQVEEQTKKDSGDPQFRGWNHIYYTMTIAWYLFDKPKFWRYVDHVMKLKDNIQEIDYKTNTPKKPKTCRLAALSKLLPFLAEEGYWEDLEKILKMYSETKQTKAEYKLTTDILRWGQNFYYARTPEDRAEGKLYGKSEIRKDMQTKYRQLLNKYIIEPESRVKKVKESYIISWEDFKG